jgi:hypothetical protein
MDTTPTEQALDRGISLIQKTASGIDLPFRFFPETNAIAVLWPVPSSVKEQGTDDDVGDLEDIGA